MVEQLKLCATPRTGSETTPPYAAEAADLAQNRPLWRMMLTYGTMQS